MSRFIQSMASLVSIIIVLGYGMLLMQGFWQWATLLIILLITLFMIWARPDWWTYVRYMLCTGGLIVLVLLLTLSNSWHPYGGLLLFPLLLVLARDVEPFGKLSAGLAAVTGIVMLAITYPSGFASTTFPWMVGCYLSVRGINKYKEAYRVSQLHLRELGQAHRALEQAHEALQESTIHTMRYAALAERTRLAHDIHDGLGHQLTSLIVQMQALEIMLPDHPQQAAETLPTMLIVARKAMSEVRQAVHEWNEDESGLGLAALQGLVSQVASSSALALNFQLGHDLSDWPLEISTLLYRILQEALTNIMRHAHATVVNIALWEEQSHIILGVADNGQYSEAVGFTPGFGLQGMMERCQAAGGTCSLSQNQPHGLKIQVTLPVDLASQHGGLCLTTGSRNRNITLSSSGMGRETGYEG